MGRRNHEIRVIGAFSKQGFGDYASLDAAVQIVPSWDNNAFYQRLEYENGAQQLVFNGALAETVSMTGLLSRCALSYDGTRLATTRSPDHGATYDVAINGVVQHQTGLKVIDDLVWLDDKHLAWSGWNSKGLDAAIDEQGIRSFVNGEDVGATMKIDIAVLEHMRMVTQVTEGDQEYFIFDDGARSEKRPKRDNGAWADPVTNVPVDQLEHAFTRWGAQNRGAHTTFRGVTGPHFDAIEEEGGMPTFTYSADRRRVAYAGVRYGGFASVLSRRVNELIKYSAKGEGDESPLWAIPLARLFNPYNGPGHAFIMGSRRYHPVNNDHEWTRGYRQVGNLFFTPNDALVATVVNGRHMHLAIDEVDGPAFDRVLNARYITRDKCVCYLALRGNEVLRVTVH